MQVKIAPSWGEKLQSEFDAPYFSQLTQFVRKEYATGPCYPPGNQIFNAFNLCPFDKVKVVILGQDPYHEEGQAEGLCFSVSDGVQWPPSLQNIFKETKNYTLEDHFVRIPWAECMRRFGSDKPDMRFGNEIQDITSVFENTEFQVFKNTIENGGVVNCVKFENAADKYSRKGLDQLQDFVKHGFKAKALAYLKMENDLLTGSIAKVLSEEEKAKLVEKLGLANNDLVLVIADSARIAQTSLGALRVRLGHELNLIPTEETYKFLWVTDFPMFEYSEEDQRWVAAHHPFTAPKEEDVDKLFTDPGHVSSRAYDLVLNGYELLSGSIRIHSQELQAKVFEAIGLSLEDAKARFGFFLDSFRYGTPPHGGVGIGLERLIMVLAGTDNIRDVVAFPTTNSSFDLMSEAPNVVDKKQLDILGIEISKQEK